MTASARSQRAISRTGANGSYSTLNLVNLLLRETAHKIRIIQIDAELEEDPELFVVTSIEWRDRDRSKPMLHQLPLILSILETLRGTRGIPSEVHLNSTEGISVYLPTGVRLSQIPTKPKKVVDFLIALVENTISHTLGTINEVNSWFWKRARRNMFSPRIVELMGNKTKHFDSPQNLQKYRRILNEYFSIRFSIHNAESFLRVEGVH